MHVINWKYFNWTRLFRLSFVFSLFYARALQCEMLLVGWIHGCYCWNYIKIWKSHSMRTCTRARFNSTLAACIMYVWYWTIHMHHIQIWFKIIRASCTRPLCDSDWTMTYMTYTYINAGLLRLQQIYQGLRPGTVDAIIFEIVDIGINISPISKICQNIF